MSSIGTGSDDRLLRLAERVSDGDEPDWDSALQGSDVLERRLVDALRLVAGLAEVHRSLPDSPLRLPTPALTPGRRLGPYEVLAPIGRGGMGEVYRARHARLHRDVALKLLPWAGQLLPEAAARLEREARLAASLSHRNVVTVHDFCDYDGFVFAVFELVEGPTVRQILRERGSLPWRDAVRIVSGVAEGLAAAHAAGLVHRDIKPENLVLSASGDVKILDFGLARPAESQVVHVDSLNDSGTLRGTLAYMAPEQLRGRPAAPASDVFALGCVLHELLTGENPFQRLSPGDTLLAILSASTPSLRERGGEVPDEVERLLRACLDKDSERRPSSALELAGALSRLARDEPAGPLLPPASRPVSRIRQRPLAWLGGGGLAFVLVLGCLAWWKTKPITVAVLPFAGGDDLTYLAEGLADGLANRITHLSSNRSVRVVPRTVASHAARDLSGDPRDTGRRLGVDLVLTGRLAFRGDSLATQVELIDVDTGVQRWGQTFLGKTSEMLTIEEAAATSLRQTLGLSSPGPGPTRRRYTDDREAHLFYLEGRYNWSRRSPTSIQLALDLYRRSIERDPAFALAYSGLADVLISMSIYVPGVDPRPRREEARRAALRAVALAPDLAEAQASLAEVLASADWDWDGAEARFQKAIELDPDYPLACHSYALTVLLAKARLSESRRFLERAHQLDPTLMPNNEALGRIDYFERDYDAALAYWRSFLKTEDHNPNALWRIAQALVAKGAYEEALPALAEAEAVTGPIPKGRALFGYAYGMMGRPADARSVLAELLAQRRRGYVPPTLLALVHTGLGERDKAIEWLRKGCEERADWMELLRIEPLVDSLRTHPRFPEILACARL
jgi:serine/threonine protein kinase/tetratricopeptide (TPR) repeat protein/TolB-like protein